MHNNIWFNQNWNQGHGQQVTIVEQHCPHNDVELTYGDNGGILRGFSGTIHQTKLKELAGIHVFLASIPHTWSYLFSNFRTGLAAEDPASKILYFPISDQDVPRNLGEFGYMIDVLMDEILKGGQVGVSCIGGHGRTGLILAILHGLFTKSKTPIEDIREKYCSKAVESYTQEKFVHSWLGLPIPVEIVKPCAKCNKNPRFLHPGGSRDVWCIECDAEWKEANAKRNQTSSKTSTASTTGITKYATHCRKCWVRPPEKDSLWCGPCAPSVKASDIPMIRPANFSKNSWKRMLKRITGSAHHPSDNQPDDASSEESGEFVSAEGVVKALKLKKFEGKSLSTLSDDEWQEWLEINFGYLTKDDEAPFSEIVESQTEGGE